MSSLRLAEILAARLCHDMSSPLGALVTGLDMAVEDAGSSDGTEALVLARDSARRLSQLLRLSRAAWAMEPAALAVESLEEMAAGLPHWHRLRLDLTGLDHSTPFAPLAGRVVLNMLLLGAGALPMGGALRLTGDARRDVRLAIAGPRAGWPTELEGYIRNPDTAWNPQEPGAMAAPMTVLLAADAGMSLLLMPPGSAGCPGELLLRLS